VSFRVFLFFVVFFLKYPSPLPVRNVSVPNGTDCTASSMAAHPNPNVTLNTLALPWVLSNTPAKCVLCLFGKGPFGGAIACSFLEKCSSKRLDATRQTLALPVVPGNKPVKREVGRMSGCRGNRITHLHPYVQRLLPSQLGVHVST